MARTHSCRVPTENRRIQNLLRPRLRIPTVSSAIILLAKASHKGRPFQDVEERMLILKGRNFKNCWFATYCINKKENIHSSFPHPLSSTAFPTSIGQLWDEIFYLMHRHPLCPVVQNIFFQISSISSSLRLIHSHLLNVCKYFSRGLRKVLEYIILAILRGPFSTVSSSFSIPKLQVIELTSVWEVGEKLWTLKPDFCL